MTTIKNLKQKLELLLIVSVAPLLSFGQSQNKPKHKAENKIQLSFTPQYYLNKLNVHNDGVIPHLMSAKNMAGYNLGLDFQHITRYGLVYGAGVSFGQLGHDVSIDFRNFNFFYPKNDNPILSGFLDTFKYSYRVRKQLRYISFHPTIGYRFKLPPSFMKNWSLQADFGFNFVFYFNGESYFNGLDLSYENAAKDTIFYRVPATTYFYQYGSPTGFFWDPYIIYVLNLELSKTINWGIVRDLNIGIKITYSGNGNFHYKTTGSGNETVEVFDYTNRYYHGAPISTEEYRARDFSIGLKLGVDLWPDKKRHHRHK